LTGVRGYFISVANTSLISTRFAEQSLNDDVVPTSTSTINSTLDDTGTVTSAQDLPAMVKIIYPLPDQTPQEMLCRLFEFDAFPWAVADGQSTTTPFKTWDPYDWLLTRPFVSQIVQFFKYFRADVELSFRMNTNQFYAGALMFTATPSITATTQAYIQARSWLKPKLLSAQQQDTLVLQLPWPCPERFLDPTDITTGHRVIWLVMGDVLSPLQTNSPTAADSLLVSVQVRFQNVQLVWPYAVGAPESRIVRQSGKAQKATRPRIRAAKGSRKAIYTPSSTSQPLAQAVSPPPPSFMNLPTVITDTIGSLGTTVQSLFSTVQPLMPDITALLGMLDKPEIEEAVTRVFPTGAANCCVVDRNDQSLPLTLYTGSYVNIDHETMPGGQPWKIVDIANRPCLHSYCAFTASNNAYIFPYIANGTPFDFCKHLHRLWRGSVRMQLRFYCSSFVSCRFLLVYSPGSSTSDQSLANNVTRVIDVKGDTVVSFTLPYVFQTDLAYTGAFGGDPFDLVGTLQVSIYTQIISTDTTTDPRIDMVVFSAATADCQFSYPVMPEPIVYSTWPNATPVVLSKGRIVRQADISDDFGVEFSPFIEGCTYLTDNKNSTSETSVYVTDLMKRYQSANYLVQGTTGIFVDRDYFPNPGTIARVLFNTFAFWRGGFRIKVVTPTPSTTGSSAQPMYGVRMNDGSSPGSYYLGGGAGLVSADVSAEVDFTIPWIRTVPFDYIVSLLTPGHNSYVVDCFANLDSVHVYTAVRDDFQLGFLIPSDFHT